MHRLLLGSLLFSLIALPAFAGPKNKAGKAAKNDGAKTVAVSYLKALQGKGDDTARNISSAVQR